MAPGEEHFRGLERLDAPAAVAAALLLALGHSFAARAEEPAPDPHAVQPERPTVATHAGTVAPGWLEVEGGVEVDGYDDPPRGLAFPLVAKLGLGPRAQLDLFVPVVRPAGAGDVRLGDLAAGLKWRLADDLPLLGRLAVLPILKVPTGSRASGAGTGTVDGTILLISSHAFGPVSLDVNAGYTRRSGDGSDAPRNATLWAVAAGGPAVGDFGWSAELFGMPRTTGPAGQPSVVAALCGPTFSPRPWLTVDAGVIVPITGPQPHALFLGGVWNLGRLWN